MCANTHALGGAGREVSSTVDQRRRPAFIGGRLQDKGHELRLRHRATEEVALEDVTAVLFEETVLCLLSVCGTGRPKR